jgi:gamma-glutamyltranspeptidase
MAVAVAAPHSGAVEAAREVVAAGGNAFDAAIAAAGTLTVVYPHQCSVGGDLVAIVRPAGGQPRAVLSIGAAAAGVDVAALGDEMPFQGPQTITVPGMVAGWAAVAGSGARLSLGELLAPARGLAEEGVPFSPGLKRAIAERIGAIRADPGLSGLLLRYDERLVQPVLAGTLAEIGDDWRGYYEGDLARRLAEALRKLGSPLVAADLAAHQAEVVEPLTRQVGGATWHAAPPPVQGPTFLAILGADNLLATSHRARLARDALLGDPRTGPLDPAALIAADAPHEGPRPSGDTVAVTAVDSDGNAVTLIQSLFESFGSGLLDPGTGVIFHNRGASFSLDPRHPGRIVPGSRPPHTLCPTMAVDGETVVALGCMGGRNQPWILAQVAAETLTADDLAPLIARPRWVFDQQTVLAEPGTPGVDRAGVDRAGAELRIADGPNDRAGHVQVCRLRDGSLAAASDPRADGVGVVLRQ